MNNSFSDLIRLFRDIVYRDIAYVGGGATVLLTVYHVSVGALPTALTTPYLIYLVFVSYVVGYAVMEISSITGIVTTSYRRPGKYLSWLAKRWNGEDWSNMPDRRNIPIEKLYLCLYEANQDKKNLVIRILDLKQICVTTGSNFLVSAIIFLIKYFSFGVSRAQQDLLLGTGLFLIGSFLCIMGNLQGTSQIRYMIELAKEKGIVIPEEGKDSPVPENGKKQ